MAFVKLSYVYQLMKEKDLPFFKVTDGKVLLGKNNEESEPLKAVELLEELIENIEDSMITVSLSPRSDKAKSKGGGNWDNYVFKVRLRQQEDSINGSHGVINGTVLSMLKENAELLRRLELQSKEHEIAELKKEFQKLKEGQDKPDAWEKYIPVLMQHFSGKPIAVAGAHDGEVNEPEYDKQTIIRKALIRLDKVDKDLPETLTMLSLFAEKHPEKYKSFIPIIKTQL